MLRQAASGEEALALLRDEPADLVITDLAMPGMDGMALLRAVRAEHPQTEIIMVTGYPMIESAVEAMRQGAFHYLAKPYSLDEARLLVRRALEKCRLRQQVEQMRAQLEAEGHMPPMVGNSPAMRGLRQALQRLAPTDVAVLLQGETGTGKELAARTMHAQSQRARRRFLAVNCGALAPELLESELFGHEQGAFSGALRRKEGLFEAADGGTLFLDEIGEMPVPMQVKLLRVLQEQSLRRVGGTADIPVDVRIIAATNRNLKDEVAARALSTRPLLPRGRGHARRCRPCAAAPKTSPFWPATSLKNSPPAKTPLSNWTMQPCRPSAPILFPAMCVNWAIFWSVPPCFAPRAAA